MTWVVGMPSMFGYATAVSDVKVTWSDGSTQDCLRKVYAVAPNLVAGFAGSVPIGLDLISNLARSIPPGYAPFVRYIALRWSRRARRLLHRYPPERRALGCSLMLLGVSPMENLGDAPWARADVAVLEAATDFRPTFARAGEVVSIGSGSAVEEYVEAIRAMTNDPSDFVPAETWNPGGMGRALAISLAHLTAASPAPGVGTHLQVTTVRREGIATQSINYTTYEPDGSSTPHRMPVLANGWREFQEIATRSGRAALAACG